MTPEIGRMSIAEQRMMGEDWTSRLQKRLGGIDIPDANNPGRPMHRGNVPESLQGGARRTTQIPVFESVADALRYKMIHSSMMQSTGYARIGNIMRDHPRDPHSKSDLAYELITGNRDARALFMNFETSFGEQMLTQPELLRNIKKTIKPAAELDALPDALKAAVNEQFAAQIKAVTEATAKALIDITNDTLAEVARRSERVAVLKNQAASELGRVGDLRNALNFATSSLDFEPLLWRRGLGVLDADSEAAFEAYCKSLPKTDE